MRILNIFNTFPSGAIKIISNTVKQVFFHQKGMEDSNTDEVDITDDFGDYLLKNGRVTQAEYEQKQIEAKARLNVKVRTTV